MPTGIPKDPKKKRGHVEGLGQNIMPMEEWKKKCAEGGRKAGEIRRRKAAMRELAANLLSSDLSKEDDFRAALEEHGVDATEGAAVLFAQLVRARNGDTDAARFLRDTSGQKPVDNVAVGNLDDRPFETLNLRELSDEQLAYLLQRRAEEAED